MNQSLSMPSGRSMDMKSLEAAILYGDLSKFTPQQRVDYVAKLCELTGLNPLTKPFEFMTLQGKTVCYAGKNCAEQLRMVRDVSLRITAREKIEDVYVVTAEASLPSGRVDSATGAVSLGGLKGDALANAMMKAETKAKRRVTLSICSLGMLDDTEVDSIPGANKHGSPEHNPPNSLPPVANPFKPDGSLPPCAACGTQLRISKAGTGYYCPDFKVEGKGEHTRFPTAKLDEYRKHLDDLAKGEPMFEDEKL